MGSMDNKSSYEYVSDKKDISGEKIVNNSPLPTFIIDSDGFVLMANQAFLDAYELPNEEIMIGTNALTNPSNIKHHVTKYIKEALKGKTIKTPEVDFETPHGVRRITKSRLFPIFNDDEEVTHVVVMHEDITEQKLAEERAFEARKEAAVVKERADIIESIPEIIFILDSDYRLIDWNDTAEERTGFSADDMERRSILDFIIDEDKGRMKKGIRKAIEKGYISEKGRLITKQGKDVIHSWHISSIKYKDDLKFVIFGIDITEKKKAEDREKFLNSLLRHDVKNKTQIAQGYLELAEDHNISSELKELLEKSKKANKESMDIIEKVRTLHAIEREKTEKVELSSIIKTVIHENTASAKIKNIEIDMDLPDKNIIVKGGMLLKELFTNLISNSIKHSEGNSIVIRYKDLKEKSVIIVEDDGKASLTIRKIKYSIRVTRQIKKVELD
ncbi:MAG: PAS domain S-box protein [Thermoplasmata archaeon]